MSQLKLYLLGPFQALLNDKPITEFRADSARGLLAYLAMHPGSDFRRDTLATLLWPERGQDDALVNLRQILTILRRALEDQDAATPFLLVTPQTIQFNSESNIWLDVTAFAQSSLLQTTGPAQNRTPVNSGIRGKRQAVDLYRGDFLSGFSLDSEPFDEWMIVQRERFHRLAMDLLSRLAIFHERRGEFEFVSQYAQKQLELEPWCEEAHRQLMLAYAQTGQRSAALVQYASCQRAFADAFGIDPSPSTVELYRKIAEADIENKQFTQSPVLFSNLPAQPTPLIGRDELVAQIEEQLLSPDHRLVTLLGPGGIGKTRLAVTAADRLRGCFGDGVCYVSFAELESRTPSFPARTNEPVSADDPLVAKLSNVFRLIQSDTQSRQNHLLDYLRNKEMLLVLDDLEMILDPAAEFIADILREASNIAILTTSRQPLSLLAETAIRIPGLTVPPHPSDPAAAEADSVRLFDERAHRASVEFQLNAETLPDVVKICQLVDGLPLGIELAAVWTKFYSVAEICHLLQDSPDKIGTPARDLPMRHRSLRAVFDRSWQLLSAEERSTLSQATVFRGGFDLQAARSVIAGEWGIETALNGLLDQSLLQRDALGRYFLHPPIEKFAAEKIADPKAADENSQDMALSNDAFKSSLEARHSTYYLDWVARSENSLQGRELRRELEAFRREWDNIQRAWNWATEHLQIHLLAKSLDGMAAWLAFQGRFQEGEQLACQAAQQLRGESHSNSPSPKEAAAIDLKRLLCRLLIGQAQFLSGANAYAEALDPINEAQSLATELADMTLQAAVCLQRGIAFWGKGDYVPAQLELELALAHARDIFDQPSNSSNSSQTASGTARRLIAQGHESASLVALSQENVTAARENARNALSLFRDLGNSRDEMQVHMIFGLIAASGSCDLVQARIHFTDVLIRARETGNYFYETLAKKNLGYIALALGQTNEARAYLEYSLQTFREFGNKPMQANTLCHLGILLHLIGETKNALRYSEEAADLARQVGEPFNQAVALTCLGHAQFGVGNFGDARYAYQAALELHERLEQKTTGLTPRAGIVQMALKSGQPKELAEAQPHVATILKHLHLDSTASLMLGITALYDPYWLYLVCVQFLQAQGDPLAFEVLKTANTRLHACAEKISDGELKMSFLENIPPHRAITRMWKKALREAAQA